MDQTSFLERSTQTETYLRVQQFYGAQMQLLDNAEFERWADTFEPDGVFDANGLPAPVRGRSALTAATRAARAADEPGTVTRHWIGMLTVDARPDGTVHARSYAIVVRTPRGGASVIHRSTTCEDVLVRDGDEWLVRERRVRRDDLPA